MTELQSRLKALGVSLVVDGDRLRVSAERGKLSPELQTAIREHRAELLRIGGIRKKEAQSALERFEGDVIPMSFFQERLWVLHRLDPNSTSYNMVVMWQAEDGYSATHVAGAIRNVILRRSILRSIFIEQDGIPQTQVVSADSVPIEIRRLSKAEELNCDHLKLEAINTAAQKAFDLTTEPPLRFQVWESSAKSVQVLVSAHHIAIDAWSITLLREEIKAECVDAKEASELVCTPKQLQYSDFAAWQRRIFDQDAVAEQIAWWETRLAGCPQLCLFPPDFPANSKIPKGDTYSFTIEPQLVHQIRAAARAEGVTVYMVLIAACSIVLSVHTGQEDILLGSPMGNRERAELETVIGPFVNLLVLRLNLSENPTLAALLHVARDVLLDAHAHRDVPFEALVERLKPARSLDHSPLFQVAVVLHNAETYSGLPIFSGGAIHDFTWFVRDNGTSLECSIEYRADRFKLETIERIGRHLERALAAVSIDSRARVGDISLLSGDERRCVIEAFNNTALAVDPAPVHVQIERQVARTPDAPAIRCAGAEVRYAELNQRANQLAHYLQRLGIGSGALVGIFVDRSPELLVSLLAVQKSGAAYVPLDPALPGERLRFMLEDSGVAAVIVSSQTEAELNVHDGITLVNVSDVVALAGLDVADVHPSARPEDPAYLIYTSGSTGKPKGVKIPHSALSNFVGSMAREPGLTAADVFGSVTTISFDIAGLELYLPLTTGACIELISQDISTDGTALAAKLDSSGVTMLQATPVTLKLLVDSGWTGRQGLRVLCGGETLARDLAASLSERVAELWNLYGPTETTIWSTAGQVRAGSERISIGRPIANTQIYIVDSKGEPVAIGLPGEIWIGGNGVAIGYHDRAELTEQRFIPNRFSGTGKLYRTGDLGCWDAEGWLYHLGRNDDQVKINGMRIEPGEIESAIRSHPAILDSVVMVRDVGRDELRVVAYVCYHAGEDLTATEVRRHVRRQLPDIMVPSLVVTLDSLPVTPNGKVNRLALPDPFKDTRSQAVHEAPAPGMESEIASIWRTLLKVERVGAEDNFFEIGGHSLLALQAAAAVERVLGLRMEPRSMFFSTLRQIAAGLRRHST